MEPAADPNHPGNSAEYHTGKPCIVKGCEEPGGTWWGPSWCQKHNAERLARIGKNLDDMIARVALREAVEKETADLRRLLHDAYGEIRGLVVAAGGKVTVTKAHREAPLLAEGCYYGRDGSKTYDYLIAANNSTKG